MASDLERGRLVSLLPEFRAPAAPIQAVMPPTRFVLPQVRVFVDFMEEVLKPVLATLE